LSACAKQNVTTAMY